MARGHPPSAARRPRSGAPGDADPAVRALPAVVVSGVPRSGTSLLMRMLARGGLGVLSDGRRPPDAGNPLGYYELEAVKGLARGDVGWLARARGRAVKVVHLLAERLPLGPDGPPLRVLFAERDPAEVVASQSALLERLGRPAEAADPEIPSPARLAALLDAQRARVRARLEAAPNVTLLPVSHAALLRDPVGQAARIAAFLDGVEALDVAAMAAAVDPALHHWRRYTGSVMAATAQDGVPLGPVLLVVDHRMPGLEGGPTLRVRRAEDGRELLRFDAFVEGAHWHLDPPGRDQITGLAPGADALEWLVGTLREDLPGWLARAGVAREALPDVEAQAEALARVERALRNPPFDPEALDPSRLRAREGEKWSVYPEDVLPLWVADMDFPPPEPVRRQLARAVANGDVGYPMHPRPTPLPGLFAERARTHWALEVDPARVVLLADVMQGVHAALLTFTEPDDGVVVQTPIYPPFPGAVADHGLRMVENPLRETPEGYRVDLEGLRAKLDEKTRVLLLSNPHNPTGRVYTREELEGLAELAIQHDLLILSDEIHADLVLGGARHLPTAALGPEVAERTITLQSASKAFNIAGLRTAVAYFGSAALRQRFCELPRKVRGGMNTLGLQATEAAWRHADPWREAVCAHLEAQRDFVAEFVRQELPGVRHHPPEATYLAWLDCRELGLEPSPQRFFLDRARVALSDGAAFGTPGEGFVRLNFATSRSILREALERMAKSLRAG